MLLVMEKNIAFNLDIINYKNGMHTDIYVVMYTKLKLIYCNCNIVEYIVKILSFYHVNNSSFLYKDFQIIGNCI